MVQFARFPPATLYGFYPDFMLRYQRIVADELPHSVIDGSKPASSSPSLFAACHDLHRPQVPRHPPYALKSLNLLELSTYCGELQLRDFYSIFKELGFPLARRTENQK